ncbi:MAG: sugar ABC transporter substrate-binding protein [Ignavibacteriae bacterium]|nr:MAG: sugar ABC transporter substrate-binding protein [Ignavibacteriota bacterium]
MKKRIVLFVSIIVLVSAMGTFVRSQEKLRIAVIPKSSSAVFWKSVHGGVKLGAAALGGTEVVWKAPLKDDDLAQQISLVEQCISEGVSGIALAPLDKDAFAKSIAKAAKKKIPVLIFDSALRGTPGKDFISIVGIDNIKAGIIAGEQLAKFIGGRGKVVMLRVVTGQSNITNREEGFLKAIATYKGIRLIEKDLFVSGTAEETMNKCMKSADKLRDADGVFCSYEQSTMGMLFALRNLNLAGKVKFVGFDIPAPALEALKNGEISALITQDPARMGYYSVKTIVDYIRGKKVSTKIDIDVDVITRENINDPDVQKLIALPSMSD